MARPSAEDIKRAVNQRYGERARQLLGRREAGASSCCPSPSAPAGSEAPVTDATSCCGPGTGTAATPSWLAEELYTQEELNTLPQELAEQSLGCGNPTAIAELAKGESVLDLGSGAGLDCFLAAHKVGPTGRVVGLDMNVDMIQLARHNARKIGVTNAEFRLGEMEIMPFADASFHVIISNCVINLSPDKDAVLRESFRVLKPGGRLRVSDIVWLRQPTEREQSDLASWEGCVAGALTEEDYVSKLRAAGFDDVRSDHVPDDGQGWTSAAITAAKPLA